jgi:hypothetical protein
MVQQRMPSQTCSQGVCLYLQQPTVSVADWLAKQNQSTHHITAFSRGLYSGLLTMLQAIWLKPTRLTAHDFNT